MDTKKNAAILVDYDLYSTNQFVRDYVSDRSFHAALVMLVSNPDHNDFEPGDVDPEFSAVIRNSARTPDIVFKTSALCVLQDSSNLIPVLAFDGNDEALDMFWDGGVLSVMSGT